MKKKPQKNIMMIIIRDAACWLGQFPESSCKLVETLVFQNKKVAVIIIIIVIRRLKKKSIVVNSQVVT